MRLNKKTDFALRTLLYLAKQTHRQTNTNEVHRRIFAQEIANAYDMPINHLTKVVNELSNLGYINTYRGRNGGIELGKNPQEIFIRDIIVDFEPSLNPADCENCVLQGKCGLEGHLAMASEAFLASLGKKSLADVL